MRELIEIVRSPAEFMHQRPQRQRRIDAAPGDDNIGPHRQRACDRRRAEIGVGAGDRVAGREGRAGEHLAIPVDLVQPLDQLVALDDRDAERQPLTRRQFLHPRDARARVHATRVGDDPGAGVFQRAQIVLPHPVGEIARETRVRVAPAQIAQHRHRPLGQIIEREIIDPRRDQLWRRDRAVAQEPARAADPDRLHRSVPAVIAAFIRLRNRPGMKRLAKRTCLPALPTI